VSTIVLQAMHEASARGAPATIAVVDRVGNVLTVTQMSGAPTEVTVTTERGITGGLEGAVVPATLAAISKAVTGAYLSSNGNAFTTRTANQIIQEHFDPGVRYNPGGPLFGVQFSQLFCSDFVTPAAKRAGLTRPGPHASPLGLAAASGGLPIYQNGILAGGIGVVSTDIYSYDPDIFRPVIDNDEVIAIAGVTGYEAPASILAYNIAINGLTLQYTDATSADLAAPVEAVGTFTPIAVPNFFVLPPSPQTAVAGTVYGSPASGIVPDGTFGPVLYPGTTQRAFVFVGRNQHVRFPPKAGLAPMGGAAITAAEAQALETSALNIAFIARAAIREPLGSFAQVTVTIVDLDGNVLAQARTPDAPVFGADVSRQKARSAVFFSRPTAAGEIKGISLSTNSTETGTFADYINRSQELIGPGAFSDGIAWSEVALGEVARPFYPDGIDGNPPGSLSVPYATHWSIFSNGLQTDLIVPDLVAELSDLPKPKQGCAYDKGNELPIVSGGKTQLANGMQIFAGSVPIYRGSTLVGGIGVSGDGIQQDSMVAYLGLQDGPATLNNAPAAIRADQLAPGGIGLLYVNCPPDPFLNSGVQNAC
jgi:uncharacterized protein GlcG (DUF336 family)